VARLTTFSIAKRHIAKYFAIIPAMFVALFPGLDLINIMRLHSPQSAILSAVIFNAVVIVALIPLALRGVSLHPEQCVKAVEPQPLCLRARRHHRAVHRHQADRPCHPILTGNVRNETLKLRPASTGPRSVRYWCSPSSPAWPTRCSSGLWHRSLA